MDVLEKGRNAMRTGTRLLAALGLACMLSPNASGGEAAAGIGTPGPVTVKAGEPFVLEQVLVDAARGEKNRRHWLIDGKPGSAWPTCADTSGLIYDPLTAPGEKFWFTLARQPYHYSFSFFGGAHEVNYFTVLGKDDSFGKAKWALFAEEGGKRAGERPAAAGPLNRADDASYITSGGVAGAGRGARKKGGGKKGAKKKGGGAEEGGGGEDGSEDGEGNEDAGDAGVSAMAPAAPVSPLTPPKTCKFMAATLASSVKASALALDFEKQAEPSIAWLNEVAFYNARPGEFKGRGGQQEIPVKRGADGAFTLPPFVAQTAIEAITLRIPVTGKEKFLAGIEILDPFTTGREASLNGAPDMVPYFILRDLVNTVVSVDPAAGGELILTLDFPDIVVAKGKSLQMFLRGSGIGAEAKAVLHVCTEKEAAPEWIALLNALAFEEYSVHAEPRNWGRSVPRPGMMWLHYGEVLRLDPKNAEAHAGSDFNTKRYLAQRFTLDAPAGAPDWAVYQREIAKVGQQVVDYWVKEKQNPNGEFGTGINDDAKIPGWLTTTALLSDDGSHTAALGCARLGDCNWISGRWGADGFPAAFRNDLLHASDETSELYPPNMVMNYGSPRMAEACMMCFKTFFTDNTKEFPNGCRYFTNPRYTASSNWKTGRRMRAANPGAYAMWYAGYETATKWATQYYNGMLDKPQGGGTVVNELRANGGNWDGEWCLGLFLTTGNEKYLKGAGRDTSMPNSLWRINNWYGKENPTVPLGKNGKVSDARADGIKSTREGDKVFLDIPRNCAFSTAQGTLDSGEQKAASAFFGSGDKGALAEAYRTLAVAARLRLHHMTTAEISADRVYPHGRYLLAHTALGGQSSVRATYPMFAASYEGFGTDFAALVLGSNPRSFTALLYNFKQAPLKGKVCFWELDHGKYEVSFGPDANGDDKMDSVTEKKAVELYRAEPFELTLPPRTMIVVEARQIEKLDPIRMRADAGIDAKDVTRAGDAVKVVVHNIGAKDIQGLSVCVKDAAGKTWGESTLASLAAPNDLVPKKADVEVKLAAGAPSSGLVVVLDPDDKIPEITNRNNTQPVP